MLLVNVSIIIAIYFESVFLVLIVILVTMKELTMMIEFNQLYYLLTIVDNGFNLTRSAKVLHVSQPALSKSIAELEFRQGVTIFNRKKGRIIGLTHIGSGLVRDARKVYSQYEVMLDRLQDSVSEKKGTVRIGIAPVIISTVFNEALVQFIQNNPGIKLTLIEKGAYELQEMLVLGKLDLAILVSPVTFSSISEQVIYQDSVAVWFNRQHRFNQIDGPIPLAEIGKEKIITLNNSFMVTFQLKQHFMHASIQPDFFLQTDSWDLILNMCQKTNNVGILARPIGKNYNTGEIVSREIDPFFPWKISLCALKNVQHSSVVTYTRNWFSDYFLSHKLVPQA